MRFDFHDLRLFLAVVDAGSITRGAERVALSLAAASERLREMEAAGKVPLLVRSRRGVTPTPAGEILIRHARILLAQMNEMMDDLTRYGACLRATVRLYANTAAASEHLPPLLGSWMADHPSFDIALQEARSDEIATALREGRADLGILSDEVETSELSVLPLFVDRLVVVANCRHAIAARSQVDLATLLRESFIGSDGPLQAHVDTQALKLGVRLKHRVQVRSHEDVCRLAAAGVGVGVLPRAAVERSAGAFPIIWRQLSDTWATRRLCLCTSNARPLARPAQLLMKHLVNGATLHGEAPPMDCR